MSVLIRGICHKCHTMKVVAASIDHERYYCDKCNPEIVPLQVATAEEGEMSNGVIFIGNDAKPCTVCGKSITERFYSHKDCLRDARCRQCNDEFEGTVEDFTCSECGNAWDRKLALAIGKSTRCPKCELKSDNMEVRCTKCNRRPFNLYDGLCFGCKPWKKPDHALRFMIACAVVLTAMWLVLVWSYFR